MGRRRGLAGDGELDGHVRDGLELLDLALDGADEAFVAAEQRAEVEDVLPHLPQRVLRQAR